MNPLEKRKTPIITVIVLIITSAFCFRANAQSYNVLNNKNYEIEARMHYGFFMHHHFEMQRFNAHFPSYEFSFCRATFGKNRWETLYRYPLIGFTFYHSGLGGFEEIGEVYAIYPFINFPLNNSRNSKLTFKLGVGLSYLTNKFDPINNSQNFSIGSHVNAAVNLSFEYRQNITKQFHLISSIGLTHFSNGSTMTPNYGLNIISGALGFSCFLKKPNPNLNIKLLPKLYTFEFDGKKWFSVDCQFAVGVKDMTQEYGVHSLFYVYDFSANVMKQFSQRGKAGLALELVKDNSDKTILEQNKEIYEHEYEILKPGIGVSYEMLMDRMSFFFNLGWHVGGADLSEGSFYQKMSLRYMCHGNLFAVFSLTTHYARADYLGIGLGYRFDFNYYLTKFKFRKFLTRRFIIGTF